MNIAALIDRRQLRRKVQGIAAALLPYQSNGSVAVEAFQQHLIATHHAGLMNAVNMDTGYVNYLSEPEKRDVLRWTVEALGKDAPFVAGAYIENQTGDIVALYRQQMDSIVQAGGIPILFQTARLCSLSSKEKAAVYQTACQGYPDVLAFELGTMFAPNGEIFDEDTVRRLMDIPEIKGMKHSSLDRLVERGVGAEPDLAPLAEARVALPSEPEVEDRLGVLHGADPAADRERYEDVVGGAAGELDDRLAALVRGGDVEEDELVGALGVVALGQLDRVAGVAQPDEVGPLDDAAGVDVEARDNAFEDHRPRLDHRSPRAAMPSATVKRRS